MGRDKDGNYPRKTRIFYGTKRDAEIFARAWIYELEHPEEVQSTETVGEWLDDWFENDTQILKQWEQNTRKRAKGIIKNNLKPHIGGILLAEFNADDVMDLYKKLSVNGGVNKKKLSPRSIRYAHMILSQALDQAVVRDKIKKNPALKLTPSLSIEDDKDKWVVLSKEELLKFLNDIKEHPGSEIEHHDYALIFVAAYTGARQSELLGLTWDKVLWTEKAIRINQTLHADEDSPDGFEVRPRTKNRTSTRKVIVTDRALAVLEQIKPDLSEKELNGQFVFLEPDGCKIKANNLTRRYKRLSKRYGHEGMTFHHLRHSHATILLSEGAYVNEVSERLGHANASTTLSIYGHVLPDRPQSLALFFDELINGKKENQEGVSEPAPEQ